MCPRCIRYVRPFSVTILPYMESTIKRRSAPFGRFTRGATPTYVALSLPTELERQQMSWSTVRGPADTDAAAARCGSMLHLQEKIVESRISKGTDVKKNHARTPPRDLRRVIACGAPLLSSSAEEPSQPSWVERRSRKRKNGKENPPGSTITWRSRLDEFPF